MSQKLISAFLVLYAVSVMDGRSIMLEKRNGVQCDFGRKTPLGIIKQGGYVLEKFLKCSWKKKFVLDFFQLSDVLEMFLKKNNA